MVHDAAGRRLADGRYRYKWDPDGTLAAVRDARTGRLLARYRYDLLRRRIASEWHHPDGTVTRRLYLWEGPRLLAVLDGKGEILRQFLWLGWRPVAILTPEGTFHVHTDHRGAPTEITDEAGRIVWTADYAPFGRAHVDPDPDGDGEAFVLHLRLPGQWEDPATGLHYNLARWYDPETARYLSPDPIGQAGGLNLYAYAAADPINHVDPVGLLEIRAWVVRVRGRGNEWGYIFKFASADELASEGAKDFVIKMLSRRPSPLDLLKIAKYVMLASEYKKDRELLLAMFTMKYGVCPTEKEEAIATILEWIDSYPIVYEDGPVIDLLLRSARATGQYDRILSMLKRSRLGVLEKYRRGYPWRLMLNPTTTKNLDLYGPPEQSRF